MFFYGNGETLSVIVSLEMLETGKLLLMQPAAPLNPEHPRWQEWAGTLARAMETGGKLHVTLESDGSDRLGCRRCTLAEATGPARAAVAAALDFFAERAGVSYDPAKVEVIDLRG